MVFFNCNACGEALKKNQVEKHTYRCRWCEAVSCVDCGKDFWGSDYHNHTKCMTENEKYCGKGYVAKVNKGEVKQEKWFKQVQEAIGKASSNPRLKELLQRLEDYPNIPRKKPKFENFIKNSLRVNNQGLISQVWELLMTTANEQKEEEKPKDPVTIKPLSAETNGSSNVNGTHQNVVNGAHQEVTNGSHKEVVNESVEDIKLNKREKKEERQKKNKKEKKDKQNQESNDSEEKPKKKKKRKHEEETDEMNGGTQTGKKRKLDSENGMEEGLDTKKKKKKRKNKEEDEVENVECAAAETTDIVEEESQDTGEKKKFKWGSTIMALLEKKGEMSLKKLRRKVLAEFVAQDAANYNEENLSAKFNKKLKKLPEVIVAKEKVKLK